MHRKTRSSTRPWVPGYLELCEFVCFQFVPAQDQPNHVQWQQSKRSQVQHFVPVFVDEFQNLFERYRREKSINSKRILLYSATLLPSARGFWCICTVCNVLPTTTVHRPCPRLCNIGRIPCKLCADLPSHNSPQRLVLLNGFIDVQHKNIYWVGRRGKNQGWAAIKKNRSGR